MIKVFEQESCKMLALSIIVPIYNTEKYLSKCLDSIIQQNMQNIEIICVDDGSTDSCLDILKAYAQKDKRIRIIHKNNGGLVSARKAGIQAASGAYVGFVDSDDWIEPEMYEKMYTCAVKNHVDMVCSGYFLEGNYISTHYDTVAEGLYDESGMKNLLDNTIFNFQEKDVGIRASLGCKLFLTKKFREVQLNIPENISIAEDKVCVLSYVLNCNRVYVLKKAFYHYMIHQESMVHTPDLQYLLKVNEVYQYFISLYEHPLFTETMRLQAELYITEMLYKGINFRMGFLNENLLWIDPCWMQSIPEYSKILLYGGGALGKKYYKQIQNNKKIYFAGCIDYKYKSMEGLPFEVKNPSDWRNIEFDFVVITIKNPDNAKEIFSKLSELGIEPSRILHFVQEEIFWRFAEADGIL